MQPRAAGYYTTTMRGLHWLMIVLPLLLAGCPSGDDAARQNGATDQGSAAKQAEPAEALVVWADPLLKEPLAGLADKFKAQYAPGYVLLFLERAELVARMTAAEPPSAPDVFIVADVQTLVALRDSGVIDEASARTFAGDTLALVQPAGAGYGTATLFDIYKLRFDKLAVGAQDTSVGYYAWQALVTEGCFKRLEDRLRHYERTSELLDGFSSGAEELGIIATSQYVQADGLELVLRLGEDLHEDIRYQAVAAKGRGADEGAMRLLRFLAEDIGIQSKLEGFGLTDRQTAMVEDK